MIGEAGAYRHQAGTAAEWASAGDPVVPARVQVFEYELDSGGTISAIRSKLGDGISTYSQLPFTTQAGPEGPQGPEGPGGPQGPGGAPGGVGPAIIAVQDFGPIAEDDEIGGFLMPASHSAIIGADLSGWSAFAGGAFEGEFVVIVMAGSFVAGAIGFSATGISMATTDGLPVTVPPGQRVALVAAADAPAELGVVEITMSLSMQEVAA